MNSDRKCALVAGVLFIIGTAAPIAGMALTGNVTATGEYLSGIPARENQILLGAFLQIVMSFACAGVAIAFYPVLRRHSEALSLGAVGFRLIEAILASIAATMLLVLVTFGTGFAQAEAIDKKPIQEFASLLLSMREKLSLIMLFAWCTSALIYYQIFFRTRLVPRWISVWGLGGIILTIIADFLVLFGVFTNFSPVQVAMNMPIALQEMVFAVWLIAKGFDAKALAVLSKKNNRRITCIK